MSAAFKIKKNGATLLAVQVDYVHKDKIKGVGGRWNPTDRYWELPYTAEVWESLMLSIPGMTATEEVRDDLQNDSDDLDKPLRAAPPMPLKTGIKPFRHQYAAYAEALYTFGLTNGALQGRGGASATQ